MLVVLVKELFLYTLFAKARKVWHNTIMKNVTKYVCFNGVLAGLYLALTLVLAPISYGTIQLRIAECFCVLPALFPFSIWGLFGGCLLANLLYPVFSIYDVIFGSLTTLLAGVITSKLKNAFLAPLPPIVLNALILPLIWFLFGGESVYWINVLSIFISQSIVLYGVGVPLYFVCKKNLLPLFDDKE